MSRLAPRLEKFAAAFAAAAGFPKNPPLPVTTPTPDFCRAQSANYAQQTQTPLTNILHFPSSKDRSDELDIIRWCYAVASLPADSPRFAFYVSRWDVPGKIARAKAAGTFDSIVSNCPPIDPAWVRLVPAALYAWRAFTDRNLTRPTERPESSGIPRRRA